MGEVLTAREALVLVIEERNQLECECLELVEKVKKLEGEVAAARRWGTTQAILAAGYRSEARASLETAEEAVTLAQEQKGRAITNAGLAVEWAEKCGKLTADVKHLEEMLAGVLNGCPVYRKMAERYYQRQAEAEKGEEEATDQTWLEFRTEEW